MTAAVAIVWNRLPASSWQMQFADFDSLVLIRSSSQLAFILQSRLSGLPLSHDCCGCNWQNGLWLSSPQMRFAVFDSCNSFWRGTLDSSLFLFGWPGLIPGEDNGQRSSEWNELRYVPRPFCTRAYRLPKNAAQQDMATKDTASVVPLGSAIDEGFSPRGTLSNDSPGVTSA
jgi:hypothetical protein